MAPFVTRISESRSTLRPVVRSSSVASARRSEARPFTGGVFICRARTAATRVDDVIGERRGARAVERHGLDPGRKRLPTPLLGLIGREALLEDHEAGMTGKTTRDGYALVWSTV